MAFEDISRNLGQIATGWLQGSTEREAADRAEQQALIDRAVSHGAQGQDYAPFFADTSVRPASVDTLHNLQQQSGGITLDTPPNALMLQRPFAEGIARQQAREQAARTEQETMYQAHAQDAEERQTRLFQQQQEMLQQRQQAPLRRTDLSSAQWHDVNTQINTTVNAGLQAADPEFLTTTPRGPAITERFQAVQSAIVHAVRQRLPDHLPADPVARGNMIEEIYNDVARGITRTEPSGHWFTGGYNPSQITYNEQAAAPRRQYGTGQVTPNQPAQGSATPPAPSPAQAERANSVLQQYGQFIRPAATEFGVPPQVVATVIGPAEGGSPGAVSPVSPASGQAGYGMMQIEPPTYAEVARRIGEPGDIRDPRANIRVGTAYLSQLLRDYGGNYTLALAAYNWGPRNVNRVLTQVSAGAPRSDLLMRLPPSTQAYLARVGDAMGGWDASGASFIGLTGQRPTPNQQPGDVSRNVAQTSPGPEHQAQMEILLNQMERTARLHILSITDFTARQRAKDEVLAQAERTLRQQWAPFAQWGVASLRARLNDLRG